MKILTTTLIFILLFFGCTVLNNRQYIKKISFVQKNTIIKLDKDLKNNKSLNRYFKIKNTLLKKALKEYPKSINLKEQDYFFLMEGYDPQFDSFFGRIWNESFDIRYSRKNYDDIYLIDTFGDLGNRTMQLCKLAEQWDTLKIKEYAKKHYILGGCSYFFTRVKNNVKKHSIEKIETISID